MATGVAIPRLESIGERCAEPLIARLGLAQYTHQCSNKWGNSNLFRHGAKKTSDSNGIGWP
eukprot:1310671-Pyramimonas_sp.AAC.1